MLALSFLFYMYLLFNSPQPSLFLCCGIPAGQAGRGSFFWGLTTGRVWNPKGNSCLASKCNEPFCFEKENLSNKLTFLPSYRQCMKIKVQGKSRGLSHSFPHLPLTRCLPESVAVGAAVGAHQLCGAHPDIWKTLSGRGIKQQASANYNSCL